MSEPMVADRWLYDVLAGDDDLKDAAPGGVHSEVAPQGTLHPFVVFSMPDATDVRVVGGQRILTDATYLVKVVSEGASYGPLEVAVDIVDGLLHNAAAVTEGGRIVWCVRESPVRFAENVNGEEYRHLGAYYRIQVREE